MTGVQTCALPISPKTIELANAGENLLAYKIETPKWITLSKGQSAEDTLTEETRFVLSVKPQKETSKDQQRVLSDENDKHPSIRHGFIKVYSGKELIAKIPVTDETDTIKSNLQQLATTTGIAASDIAIEDSGRCVINADNGKAASKFDEKGWKIIPHLGRSKGSLLEGEVPGAQWSCPFYLTEDGDFTLELHRFPSLNSVGRLRIGLSVDNGEMQIFESASTDEHRANWKHNILNNVDLLTGRFEKLTKGLHTLTFTVIDPYVSFTRAVLYQSETAAGKEKISIGKLLDGTGARSNLGLSLTAAEDEFLPIKINLDSYCSHWYGDVTPEPRPDLYLPNVAGKDTLADDDIMLAPDGNEQTITPAQLLEKANAPVSEQNGTIAIDAASALAQTRYANATESADGINWNYCDSPSYKGTGLAMYIEQEGLSWNAGKAPKLTFTVKADGGHYCIWVRTWQWGTDSAHYTIGIDGNIIPEEKLYGGRPLWKYASEHVWKWAPVWECDLEAGEHEVRIYSLNSRLRISNIMAVATRK